uniref:Papain-like cysteine peptidase n=1 Tax=viral metagenome TaxID=1070528 RepID=A0A6C0E1T5_9ZZZZ
MNKFLKSFDKIISLGSNCYIKMFLDSHLKKEETQFFDYIGTSMWSINELIKNDFQGLYDYKNFEKKHILNKGDKYIFTNNLYYVRFKHDFNQNFSSNVNDIKEDKKFLEFVNKYKRRQKRFMEILNSKENILFIRYEEDNKDRIKYYEEKDEIEFIYEFMKILKTINPNKKFFFILLSHEKSLEDKDNNLFVVKINDPVKIWTEAPNKIKNTLLENEKKMNLIF